MKEPSLWKGIAWFARELGNYVSLLSEDRSKETVVFYSERDIYYQYFEGLIEYLLENSTHKICYITSDPEDPMFRKRSGRIIVFYLHNLLASCLARLNARVLVMTMTDLHQFHIKRSSFPVHYVYLFHAVVSTHLQYLQGAFDHYDTVFCVGPHHVKELRRAEELYHLKPKILIESGYHRIEKIYRDHLAYLASAKRDDANKRILVAPTWGDSSILEICIDPLIDTLATTEYQVSIRPHPEFTKRRPELVKRIRQRIEKTRNIEWEEELLSDRRMHEADVLITDRSGIAFEYAFGTERPVLFIDTPLKIQNARYKELGIEPLEVALRNQLGVSIDVSNISNIPSILQEFLENQPAFQQRIVEYRDACLFHWMKSAEVEGEYILSLFRPSC